MQFTAKVEYACIALIELAVRHADPQPVRVKTIADTHGLDQRFLVQILLQLKGAGLVLSTRGATGGYHLAKPPAEISLAAILSVLDRPSRTARRSAEEGVTAVVKTIRGVWDDLETARQRLLEQTTLSELVRRTEENYALTYQI